MFEVNDLKLVLEPKLHIDEFCSKIGSDADIIVISFLVNDKQASIDLVDFFEKGYNFILDADISTSEIKPGSFLVFIELLRRQRVVDQLFNILEDLEASSGINKNEWKFKYVTNEKYFPLTKENFISIVPLSPKSYKEHINKPINEIKELAGIPINEHIEKNQAIQKLQHAAGII